jgi:hypothetical protein
MAGVAPPAVARAGLIPIHGLIHHNAPCRKQRNHGAPFRVLLEDFPMMDVLMVALTFGWFALAIGYAYACERL